MERDGLLFGTLMALAVGLGTLLGIVLTCWVYDRAKRHYTTMKPPPQTQAKRQSSIFDLPPLWGSSTYTFTETTTNGKSTNSRHHRSSTAG